MTKPNRSARLPGFRPGKARCGGFTLIEVVTVLVIMGLLSAFIVTRSTNLNGDLSARLSEVRSQLRYLQLLAMKSNISYLGLQSDGTNYWAYNYNATNGASTNVALPGETAAVIPLSSKSMQSGTFNIRYDSLGIPYNGSSGSKLSSAATITITVGGASGTLTVAPETGFVQ